MTNRRAVPALAVAGTVITVFAVAAAIAAARGDAPNKPGAPRQVTRQVTRPPAGVSAATLQAYRWRQLPPAPIATRTDAAVAWTGSRMIVWGGAHKNTVLNDGATYDPKSRTWAKLPPAPLSPRADPSAVFVGGVFVVLSGDDGARYDPRSNRWTKLPTAPVSMSMTTRLLAADGQAVLITTATDYRSHVVNAAVYRPATNRWRRLNDLVLPATHLIGQLGGVAADRLFIWAYWAHTVQQGSNGTATTVGVDAYALDTKQDRWTRSDINPHAISQPFWTGRRLLLMDENIWCGFCPGPFVLHPRSEVIDTRTGARTTLTYGPVDGAIADFQWTGEAIVALNPDSEIGRTVRPGDAAAWNPATNRWVSLAAIPHLASQPQVLWAGDRLLVWGGEPYSGHSLTGEELAPR